MSIKFNHRLGTIDVDTSTYDTTSVTSNTDYTITVSVSDAAVVANANSTVDFYYNGTITARAGGIGGIGCFEITEGDVAGDAGARILYFIDSANAIKASINSGTNSGDFVIDNNVANKDINLTPSGTGNVALGNFVFDADQTVGAGQDNYVFTYDNATGLISLEVASGGGLSGTVANDQVVVGTGASSVDSSSTLTYDATTLTISSGNVPSSPPLEITSARPIIVWNESDATADNKRWYMHASAEDFQLVAINDANSASNPVFTVARTGTTVDSITFGAFGSFEAGLEAIDGAGGDGIFLESTTNESGAGLNLPFVRWREADQTSVAGIRGAQNAGSTLQSLILGTGFFTAHLTLNSDDAHAMTGSLDIPRIIVGDVAPTVTRALNVSDDDIVVATFESTSTDSTIIDIVRADAATNGTGIRFRNQTGGLAYFGEDGSGAVKVSSGRATGAWADFSSTTMNVNVDLQMASGEDIQWAQASQPWVTLDSNGGGADPWDNQGAGISVGESGKKGSAAIHITYQGAGVGRFGMGTVDDTTGSGGAPAYGHFRMVYNNYNVQAAGRLFPGYNSNTVQSTRYIEATTGYGSINVGGAGTSSWVGYSIDDDFAFIVNDFVTAIYNQGAAEYVLFQIADNSYDEMRYNNSTALRTVIGSSDGYSVWCQVEHNNGSLYDIGLNTMDQMAANANLTLDHTDCGGYYYHSNASTYTITLNNTAAQGASFPVGGTFFVINNGSVGVNVTGSGVSVANPHLGTTGNRTIAANSTATILKYDATTWFVWGTNVT